MKENEKLKIHRNPGEPVAPGEPWLCSGMLAYCIGRASMRDINLKIHSSRWQLSSLAFINPLKQKRFRECPRSLVQSAANFSPLLASRGKEFVASSISATAVSPVNGDTRQHVVRTELHVPVASPANRAELTSFVRRSFLLRRSGPRKFLTSPWSLSLLAGRIWDFRRAWILETRELGVKLGTVKLKNS